MLRLTARLIDCRRCGTGSHAFGRPMRAMLVGDRIAVVAESRLEIVRLSIIIRGFRSIRRSDDGVGGVQQNSPQRLGPCLRSETAEVAEAASIAGSVDV